MLQRGPPCLPPPARARANVRAGHRRGDTPRAGGGGGGERGSPGRNPPLVAGSSLGERSRWAGADSSRASARTGCGCHRTRRKRESDREIGRAGVDTGRLEIGFGEPADEGRGRSRETRIVSGSMTIARARVAAAQHRIVTSVNCRHPVAVAVVVAVVVSWCRDGDRAVG